MGDAKIPSDWTGEYCRYSVCWPNSVQWLAVLRGVLALPTYGRYWNEDTGNIRSAQNVILETLVYNMKNEEVIMSCGDGGLSEIANAITMLAAKQCCGDAPPANGGVQVVVNVGGQNVPVYGNEPPAVLQPGDVPPGWVGTTNEYRISKCNLAKGIITGYIQSLRNLSQLLFVQTTLGTVAVIAALAGILVFPPFAIPALIAALVVLVGANAFVVSLANEVEADYDLWVCALYAGDSTETILDRIAELLDQAIARIPDVNPWVSALKTLGILLMNTDTLNQLFTLTGQYGGGDLDCESCGAVTTIEYGTPVVSEVIPVSTLTRYASAEVAGWGGCGDLQFYVILRKDGDATIVDVDIIGTATPCDYEATPKLWSMYEGDLGTQVYNSNTKPEFPITTQAGSIFILAGTPFEVDVLVTG